MSVPTGRLVLRGARLVDGLHAARPGMTIVVDGERIAQVEADGAVAARPGDRVVACDGASVMPGLVSCHFHTTFEDVSPLSGPSLGLQAAPARLALLAAKNVRTAIDCGVTSVVCSSTPYAIDASIKEAIEEGWLPGPRMRCGSSELMSTGDLATGGSRNWYMQLGNTGMVRTADGADGFRRLVREEIKRGAEVVKISASQGHNAGPTVDRVSLCGEELEAVVDTAHARGALVRAHCVSRAAILACARAGVDILDHADQVDEACIEAILAAGATLVPSAFYVARTLGFYDSGAMEAFLPRPVPPQVADTMHSMREDLDRMCAALPRLVEAGVDLVTGDDFGTVFLRHGEYAQELAFYVKEVGIGPLEVLRWATAAGARRFGMGRDLGVVEAGRIADLLVVDGDPLADITCLQRPGALRAVLKGGVLVRDALPDGSRAGAAGAGPPARA